MLIKQIQFYLISTGVDSSSPEISIFSECSHELGEMCKVHDINIKLLE